MTCVHSCKTLHKAISPICCPADWSENPIQAEKQIIDSVTRYRGLVRYMVYGVCLRMCTLDIKPNMIIPSGFTIVITFTSHDTSQSERRTHIDNTETYSSIFSIHNDMA